MPRGEATKAAPTRPPALSRRHVRRPRLTRLLDAAPAHVVIVAPAGYGKTTLAAEWLAGKKDVAWYAASRAAADLAAFSVEIGSALEAIVPGAGERLRRRVRVGDTPERSARPLAELLAEDLAAWPEDAWLAIDDYHVVADSAPVEEFVDCVLTLAPLRLLVTSRRPPKWSSARRILYGEVTQITTEQLAMTNEEASLRLDAPVSDGIAALVEQAEGWPALIGLASLSISSSLPEPRMSQALFRYFAEEVLRREPRDVQTYMLAASVPPAVDARVASEVLGLPHPHGALQRLADEGLLHESREGLRFHPLLRDFLLRKLREEDEDHAAALYERAIEDARRASRREEAFELAVESGRLDTAADVMVDAVRDLLDSGRIETAERWLAACEAEARDRAALVVANAEISIRRGRLFEAAALAHDLARRLPRDDLHASSAWYVAGRAFHLLSRDEDALTCHLTASETATNGRDKRNALWGATALASQLETDATDRLVAELEAVAGESLDARLQHASAKTFLACCTDSLAGVWKGVEPLVHLAESAKDPMAKSSFFVAAAYLCLARGRYRVAHEAISTAIATTEEFRLGRMKMAFCLCQRAAIEIGLRAFSKAEATIGEIARLGIDHTSVLLLEERNLRLKLLLAQGDVRRAADIGPSPPHTGVKASLGERSALVAIAAAALGDAERSRAEAERAHELTRSIDARFSARFARVIEGLAANGTADEARGAAIELLFESFDAEVLDPFVLAYRAYPPLLTTLAEEPRALAIVRDVIEHASDQSLARKLGIPVDSGRREEDLGVLTPRENEVLRLMAEGLGNAAISRRLFISEKTTKVHVYHIFEKLGVATRVQAVLASKGMLVAVNGGAAAS